MNFRSCFHIFLLLTAFFAVGCVEVEHPGDVETEYETVFLETGDPAVRAAVEDGTRILWEPGDKIQVFTAKGGKYDFSSLTEDRSVWSQFSGEVPVGTDLDGAWAVYPGALYSSVFSGSLSSVAVQLDSIQTAVEDAFPKGGIISFSRVLGNSLRFRHLCGGLKIRLTQEGITSVKIQSRGGAALAGIARVTLSNDTPKVSSYLKKAVSVTLQAPKGESLRPGVWYYVSCLPAQTSGGVDVILTKGEHHSSKSVDSPVTFSSGRVGCVDSLDRGMTFGHKPVLEIDLDEAEFGTAGGDLQFHVNSTSVPELAPDAEWLSVSGCTQVADEDGVVTWSVILNASPNESESNRQCKLSLSSADCDALSLKVVQRHGYESSDYSLDGRVTLYQSATVGEGVALIVVGDAFSDRLVAEGISRYWMEAAAESFFEVEPYTSFRDRFNVYLVDAVSRNEDYGSRMSHALGSAYDGAQVTGSLQAANEYACRAVENLDEATVIVVMNSSRYGGVAYTGHGQPGEFASGFGAGFVPHCGDVASMGRLVRHEAGGHAFAKLADEYSTPGGNVPSSAIEQKKEEYDEYGWWCNLDFTSDPSAVKWSAFLSHPRYASENLGVYEGGMTYTSGVWRSSLTGIMDNNYGTYNAPSREMIYKRIRHLSEGPDWEYSFEEFVDFDLGAEPDTLISPTCRAALYERTTARRPR